jgi:hypothetical protein
VKRSARPVLVRLAAAGLLLASSAASVAGPLAPTALAASPSVTHSTTSPFRLVGRSAGQRSTQSGLGSPALRARGAAPDALGRAARGGPSRRAIPGGALAHALAPAVAPAPVLASLTTAPDNHLAGFTGLAETDQASPGLEPADSSVAVGPDQVVQVANLVMRVTARDGSAAQTRSIPGLFELGVGLFDRDPRVIYDSLHGRFVATETTWDCSPDSFALFGHGFLDVAVSRTTDPRGTWDVYFWEFDDVVPALPSIGTSTDKLALTSTLYEMSQSGGGSGAACADPASLTPNLVGADVMVANWADAVANTATTLQATEFLAGSTDLSTLAPTAVGARAALQEPATSATLFMVSRSVAIDTPNNIAVDDVLATTFTGTTSGTSTVTLAGSWTLTGDGIVAPFADPAAPHQPGSPATIVNATSGDPPDAIWQAGKLTWPTTYPCTPSGDSSVRDCVRISQVATPSATAEPTAVQDFLIGLTGFDSYSPGVGLSSDGTLNVVYSQSNTTGTNFPSSVQQYQGVGDGANTLSPPVVLAAGTSTYPGAEWGHYVGLGQDPQLPSAVWQGNAFSVGTNGWSTFVDQLGPTAGTTYVPITPLRVVDTRGTGSAGAAHLAAKFVASHARTFMVANLGIDPSHIASNAVAVTGNVTVTAQNAAGYLAVTPTAQNNPGSSTLNFPASGDRANNVTVPLAPNGGLSITYKAATGKTTDVVFDVTGYFVPDNSSSTYKPVVPTRLIDSRSGLGQPANKPKRFVAKAPQTFTIGTSGGLVPETATAITGNLTVTRQTKAGYLALTRTPTGAPSSSTLNFPLGDDRANGFTAPLNSGQLSIVYIAATGGQTDVILDVTGYYGPGLSGGLHFYPINPGRIMDTRTGVANSGLTGRFSAAVPRQLPTSGHWGVPDDAQAVSGNLTVTAQTGAGYIALTTVSTANPGTSSLNFPLADDRANGVTVALSGTGSLWLVYKASAGKTTQLILDLSGYFR